VAARLCVRRGSLWAKHELAKAPRRAQSRWRAHLHASTSRTTRTNEHAHTNQSTPPPLPPLPNTPSPSRHAQLPSPARRTRDARELAQRAQRRRRHRGPQQLWRDAVERRRPHAQDDAQALDAGGVVGGGIEARQQAGHDAVDGRVRAAAEQHAERRAGGLADRRVGVAQRGLGGGCLGGGVLLVAGAVGSRRGRTVAFKAVRAPRRAAHMRARTPRAYMHLCRTKNEAAKRGPGRAPVWAAVCLAGARPAGGAWRPPAPRAGPRTRPGVGG
jgi:hypothetical protein